VSMTVVARDVTERVQAEQQFQDLLESAPDAMVVVDQAGLVVLVNEQTERVFGYTRGELVGRPVETLVPHHLRAGHVGHRQAFVRTPETRPIREGLGLQARHKDGRLLPVEISLSQVETASGWLVSAAVRDVTAQRLAEQRLQDSEQHLAAILDHAPIGVADVALDGRFLRVNRRYCEITGYTEPEILARTFQDITHPDDLEADLADVAKLLAGEQEWYRGEKRYIRKDGAETWVLRATALLRDTQNRPTHFVATVADISERRRAEAGLRESEARFRRLFEEAPIGVAVLALDGRFQQVNSRLAELTGYSVDQLLATTHEAITAPGDIAADRDGLAALRSGQISAYRAEKRYRHASGGLLWASVSVSLVRDGEGEPSHFIGQVQDIGDRKRFEGELQYLADHDHLTGMYNRRRFEEEVEREVARARRYGTVAAVLALDLDHFKDVNDSLGHSLGDQVITEVGQICRRRLRSTDVAARLGGDEFAVLLPNLDADQAELVAVSLLEAIRSQDHLDLPGGPRRVTASVGIADLGESGQSSAEQLMGRADIALYDAKDAGRDCARLYDPARTRQQRMHARLSWAERIRQALDHDRLVLHAQPILSLTGDSSPWHELLLRMRGEDDELIPPGTFVYIAERFDLARRLDRWVLHEAVDLLAREQHAGRSIRLGVNLSATSVTDPGMPAAIADELGRAGVDGAGLRLEVTETAAITNIDQARHFAAEVTGLGCGLALDDFGSGFATFHYLKKLDFDFLKIDGEFIQNLAEDKANQLIVASAVQIARGLGKHTVAEFVEDARTLQLLRDIGVDYAQGFHIARPRPILEIDLTRVEQAAAAAPDRASQDPHLPRPRSSQDTREAPDFREAP
jgi:diguanylate cyclase (GGDEF)-like protein/PAS domain S-box-containing protein